MPEVQTVTAGRSRRSNAGNRMRELLEKAHQEDEDELFKEVEDDEEFEAPADQKDVFLDEFADTDDELEDEEAEERQILRDERKEKGKSKSKKAYNPLSVHPKIPKKARFDENAAKQDLSLLDGDVDMANMAPSTLVLELRRKRREAMRVNRNEMRRSNLRASTLRTEAEIAEREALAKADLNRRGRRAQHEAKNVRVHRPLTQDELIGAALEEEERNKESLRDWLKKEESKRELRRVGRKVVKGPRWTWVSRTVGKMVEQVPQEPDSSNPKEVVSEPVPPPAKATAPEQASQEDKAVSADPSNSVNAEAGPSKLFTHPQTTAPSIPTASSQVPTAPGPLTDPTPDEASHYMRNYIILSQIPGGLPAELQVILGGHVDWDQLLVVPSRNRPINRQPPLCPFTGLPARYRHPTTMIPYANISGYKEIEALLANRYVWNEEGGCWMGGEEDVWADGMEMVDGWAEAVGLGWRGGEKMKVPEPVVEEDAEGVSEIREGQGIGKRKKGQSGGEEGGAPAKKARTKGRRR